MLRVPRSCTFSHSLGQKRKRSISKLIFCKAPQAAVQPDLTGYQFGLVGFERGRLRILDAEGLDAYACGCNRPLGS